MFWKIVIMLLFYFIASFWVSYGVITPMIVLRTANPLIKFLDEKGMVDAQAARARNRFTVLFWLVIDVAVIACMLAFANNYMLIGFGIGTLFSFLSGVGKTGPNQANKEDFIRSYAAFLRGTPEVVARVIMEYPRG